MNKARDGHLSIIASKTPNNFPLNTYYFCLPFYYRIKEVFDDNNKIIDVYLTIESKYGIFCTCTDEIRDKILILQGKKFLKLMV